MSLIVTIDHPSDTSGYTVVSGTGGGGFAYNGGTGPDGSTGFVRVTAANGGAGNGLKTFTALGAIAGCTGGFSVSPVGLTQGNNERMGCFRIWNGSDGGLVAVARIKLIGSQRYLQFESRKDNGATHTATDVAISDAAHWVEMQVVKETPNNSSNNGTNTFYVDGAQVVQHTGVDNFDNFALINRVTAGYVSGDCPSGTNGTYDIDRVRLDNTATTIGGPVLPVGGKLIQHFRNLGVYA